MLNIVLESGELKGWGGEGLSVILLLRLKRLKIYISFKTYSPYSRWTRWWPTGPTGRRWASWGQNCRRRQPRYARRGYAYTWYAFARARCAWAANGAGKRVLASRRRCWRDNHLRKGFCWVFFTTFLNFRENFQFFFPQILLRNFEFSQKFHFVLIIEEKTCEISHFRQNFGEKYCMRKFRPKIDSFRETNRSFRNLFGFFI